MKAIGMATGLAFGLLPQTASGQDMIEMMLKGLGQTAIERGEEIIGNAPEQLGDFLSSSQVGQEFASDSECLGALQVAVNAASVMANIMPFSSVLTQEDERGSVSRMRLVLNGEKIHVEAFCEGTKLKATPLPWGEGDAKPLEVKRSTFDATAGLLLLLQLQGAFDDIGDETPATGNSSTSNLAPEPMPHWEREANKPGASVYSNEAKLIDRAKLFINCSSDWGTEPSLSFFLGKSNVLFKKADTIRLETTNGNQNVYTAVPAKVEQSSASAYEGEIVTLLISALADNEADTFTVVLETFDGPIRMEFSMNGFGDAMRPVAAYCPLAADVLTTTAVTKPEANEVSEALNAALGQPNTPGGSDAPPLTAGEKEAFRNQVQACWNVGGLSTEALRTSVTVSFEISPEGKPDIGSIEMVGFQGGSDAAARQAFEAARRATIRCGTKGFDLPPEKYPHWKSMELTFDPENMRLK